MSDDGSDSSSDAEEKEEANAAMAGYSMMMPRLSTEWASVGFETRMVLDPAPLMWEDG